MRIIIEDVTGTTAEATVQRIRRQVFEDELGLKLPDLARPGGAEVLHLLARTGPGSAPVATLSVIETSGHQDLDRYGLNFDANARSARYAQLAVLKAYRGLSIPLMMIVEGRRRFVGPREIHHTWLLFDAHRAATSSMCRLLGFVPGEKVIESEYGTRRALTRYEMAPEAQMANRAAEAFLDHVLAAPVAATENTITASQPYGQQNPRDLWNS